jgi:pimeloyl-ACP methyl ester carboxylesterase
MPLRPIALIAVVATFGAVSASLAQAPRDPGSAAAAPGELKGLVRKGYVDSIWGQVHYRIVAPPAPTKAPIVFLPPNPSTSLYFAYMMEDLGTDRDALAFDLPGYGGSDRPPMPPTMAQYATSIATALEALGYGTEGKGKIDISGYHTGAYVAIELLATRPDLVGRGVLLGVPFWQGEKLARQRKRLVDERPPGDGVYEDARHVEETWQASVVHRNPFLPLRRANDLFIERLRVGGEEWWAYAADVNYDAPGALARITQPVLVLNTHGDLHAETAAAGALIKRATVVDVPELTNAIFDVGHRLLSARMRDYLDRAP